MLALKGTVNSCTRTKIIESHLAKSKNRSNDDNFRPFQRLFLYPGMLVMLQTNICPALGLSNGSLGSIVSV